MKKIILLSVLLGTLLIAFNSVSFAAICNNCASGKHKIVYVFGPAYADSEYFSEKHFTNTTKQPKTFLDYTVTYPSINRYSIGNHTGILSIAFSDFGSGNSTDKTPTDVVTIPGPTVGKCSCLKCTFYRVYVKKTMSKTCDCCDCTARGIATLKEYVQPSYKFEGCPEANDSPACKE